MNLQEILVLGVGAAVGAALLLGSVLAAVRRARRGTLAGRGGTDEVRRLGRRIRQLERMARRTEARLNGRMDELRRLLAQAEAVTARPGGAYVPQEASSSAEAVAPPAILEKQRDQIFRLRLQGLEPIDIARRMRVPVGEVELTLKLRKAQRDHARAAVDSPDA